VAGLRRSGRASGRGGRSLAACWDLAAKAAEHAARIAGVLTLYGDLRAEEIGVEALADGAVLAGWYLGEALRLQAAGRTNPGLIRAQGLLDFLQARASDKGEVGFRDALQHGPLRIKAELEAALKVLADHGCAEESSARPRTVQVWPSSEGGER
jgi:hypothetical protein